MKRRTEASARDLPYLQKFMRAADALLGVLDFAGKSAAVVAMTAAMPFFWNPPAWTIALMSRPMNLTAGRASKRERTFSSVAPTALAPGAGANDNAIQPAGIPATGRPAA